MFNCFTLIRNAFIEEIDFTKKINYLDEGAKSYFNSFKNFIRNETIKVEFIDKKMSKSGFELLFQGSFSETYFVNYNEITTETYFVGAKKENKIFVASCNKDFFVFYEIKKNDLEGFSCFKWSTYSVKLGDYLQNVIDTEGKKFSDNFKMISSYNFIPDQKTPFRFFN